MKIEINLMKKHMYAIVAMFVFVFGVVGVVAYGTANPTLNGHDVGEIAGLDDFVQQKVDAKVAESLDTSSLLCQTVDAQGQDAYCPEGFIVTGCSAGMNKGSIAHHTDHCHTHETVDWTQARCCRIE